MSDTLAQDTLPKRSTAEVWSSRVLWASAIFCIATVSVNLLKAYSAYRSRVTLACNEPVFDFGTVFDGDAVEHTFELRNFGRAEVVVSKVLSGCGCTVAAEGIEGTAVPPQGMLLVPVKLSTLGTPGELSRSVRVVFEGTPPTRVTLTVRGIVQPRFSVSPTQLVLTTLDPEVEKTETITIRSHPSVPEFNVSSVRSPAKFLRVSLSRDEVAAGIEQGTPWKVAVTTIPPLPVGRHNSTVYIETTDPIIGTIPVRVVLAVKADSE